MALRGWRLFGVAGTIFAYVAGILLLSVISLNSPHQRRSYEVFKHRELGILNRRPPLQWCTELRYLTDSVNIPIETTTQKPINFHPDHFIEKYEKYLRKNPPNSLTFNATRSMLHTWKLNRKNILKRNLDNNGMRISYSDNNNLNYMANHFGDKIENQNKFKPNAKSKRRNDDGNDVYEKNRPNKRTFLRKSLAKSTQVPTIGLTALASFPGSGNTWLRYLLQQSTGILTGSVYKDFGLLKSGFPAENVCNSSVLCVKTHEWGPNAWKQFSRAILVIRDPEQSILAEFNRQSGGHVGFASPERYRRTRGRYWQQFVTNKLWAWEQMNLQWAKNFTGDVHIVYYDDLVENTNEILRGILHFLEYPINEELFNCAMSRKEGIYRRKKRIMAFDPYTPAMHAALEAKKHEVYAVLGRYKY